MSPSTLLGPALISTLAAPPVVEEAPGEPPARATPALASAHVPALGMQVRSVGVDTGPEQYALTPRSWADVVAESPALQRDQRRAELFAPGVAGVGLGSLWLVVAAAVTFDEFRFAQLRRSEGEGDTLTRDEAGLSASEIAFRFVLPSALLISGAILATKGGRARRRLEHARQAFFLGPQVSRGGGGMSVGGRF